MSKKARIKQKRIDRSQASQTPAGRAGGGSIGLRSFSAGEWGMGLGAIVAVAIVLVVALGQSRRSTPASARVSNGLAPAFSQSDVTSGAPIASAGLRGKNVLLFFSEGVMCQACFEQIQSLEQRSAELRKRGLTLINITTDTPDLLRQAVSEYHIKTPMISDESRAMSSAYGAVGQGMHPDTDGHTFVLIDRSGRIRWRRDYTTMFVPPKQLFAEIPKTS